MLKMWTYLGTTAGIGVAAGQRRRCASTGGDYDVVADGKGFRRKYGTHLGVLTFTADELANDTLIPEAPSAATPTAATIKHTCSLALGSEGCKACAAEDAREASPVAARAPAPPRREVRTTGGTWINYDSMVDPDPFEAYPLRRLNGVVAAIAETSSVRIVGTYDDNESPENDSTADLMREIDAVSRKPPSSPLPVPSAHSMLWGGCWSLRAIDVDRNSKGS
jgi:hypothetical protein